MEKKKQRKSNMEPTMERNYVLCSFKTQEANEEDKK